MAADSNENKDLNEALFLLKESLPYVQNIYDMAVVTYRIEQLLEKCSSTGE